MKTEDLDYALPTDRIAQRPPARRDGGRLLVVRRSGLEHRTVGDWPELLPPEALVVFNDTRVLKARLLGRRQPSGGKVEILLLGRRDSGSIERQSWTALGRASKPLRPGTLVDVGALRVEIVRVQDGLLEVELSADGVVDDAIEREGHVPLPPYIRRADDEHDAERYQTVYGQRPGSAAAPTAGLHATAGAIERMRRRGVEVGYTTLHVGLGTFKPVVVEDLDDHPMHAEWFEVSEKLAAQIAAARRRRAPVVAVGTTVVRSRESCHDPSRPGHVMPASGETRLLIQPGYRFSIVDSLLTNFHMPRSTLLALVGAFGGMQRVRDAYREALAADYRFLSYGDAMWLVERAG